MDIRNLLRGRSIEVHELLTSWGSSSLLVVGRQSSKERVDTGSNAIGVVDGLGLVGSMVLGIELVEGLEEAAADTVLLVEIDGTLNGGITHNVSMSKVLSNDAAAGLLLLGDVVALTLGVGLVVASIILVATCGAGNLNLSSTKLGVVEEEGSLGSGFLLESNGGRLSRISFGDLEAGDLATVKSKFLICEMYVGLELTRKRRNL